MVPAYAGEHLLTPYQYQELTNDYWLNNPLPVNTSLYSFLKENQFAAPESPRLNFQSSLIPRHIHPIELLCHHETVDYICLNKSEINSIISLPSTQIKARKIVTLAFNTYLNVKLIAQVCKFLHHKIEVDKLMLNNTGLTYREISELASLTQRYSINLILYLDLCGNPLLGDLESEELFLELQGSLQTILKNCPFLVNLHIESQYVMKNRSDFEKKITKNAGNLSTLIQYHIEKNNPEQLKALFQEIVILKSLDIFMEEFYEYAIKHNSLLCLDVLLNLPTAKNHTQAIHQLAEKTCNTCPNTFFLIRENLFKIAGNGTSALESQLSIYPRDNRGRFHSLS